MVGRPQSGYELRKFFSATPALVYQPSPGALYPALRRLERRGLLHATRAVSAGRRARRVYQATSAGQAVHRDWINQPVTGATVGRDLGLHLMRFVMMERVLSREQVHAFLEELGAALDEFIGEMERYTQATPLAGTHPGLALQHGIDIHRASRRWVQHAIQTLAEESKDVRAGVN